MITGMKVLVIGTVLLLFGYSWAFSQENRPLSISDFIGTYRLEKIEDPWHSDEVREEIYSELVPSHNTFVIDEDYYVLGGFKEETVFAVKKIEEDGLVPMNPAKTSQYTSESMDVFLDIPRLFDSVFTCGGGIWIIEPLDYDTVVIKLRFSYLLYRRVE
jgi:hypothetical protein